MEIFHLSSCRLRWDNKIRKRELHMHFYYVCNFWALLAGRERKLSFHEDKYLVKSLSWEFSSTLNALHFSYTWKAAGSEKRKRIGSVLFIRSSNKDHSASHENIKVINDKRDEMFPENFTFFNTFFLSLCARLQHQHHNQRCHKKFGSKTVKLQCYVNFCRIC